MGAIGKVETDALVISCGTDSPVVKGVGVPGSV